MKEVMGIDVSMGIGDWVKNPGELILSHDMAEQVMQYRYLLGGSADRYGGTAVCKDCSS